MLRNLFRPFAYLGIKHPDKRVVDWCYPTVLTLVSLIVLVSAYWHDFSLFFSEKGLLNNILGFVQILPGFYIAALAAIATFDRINIDKTMPSPAPKMKIYCRGEKVFIDLTRRRFLCSMFAFLTAESIFLSVAIMFVQPVYSAWIYTMRDSIKIGFSVFILLSILFIFWQMLVTTFWGLFYLGERIHQPD